MYIQGSLIERDGEIFYGDVNVSYVRDCVYFIAPYDPSFQSPVLYYIQDGDIKAKYLGPKQTSNLYQIRNVPNADEVEHLLMISKSIAIVFCNDHYSIYEDYSWSTIPTHIPVEHRILDHFMHNIETIICFTNSGDIEVSDNSTLFSAIENLNSMTINTSTFYTYGYWGKIYTHKLVNIPITVHDGVYYDSDGDIFTVQLTKDGPYIRMLDEGERIYKRRQAARFGKTKSARNI